MLPVFEVKKSLEKTVEYKMWVPYTTFYFRYHDALPFFPARQRIASRNAAGDCHQPSQRRGRDPQPIGCILSVSRYSSNAGSFYSYPFLDRKRWVWRTTKLNLPQVAIASCYWRTVNWIFLHHVNKIKKGSGWMIDERVHNAKFMLYKTYVNEKGAFFHLPIKWRVNENIGLCCCRESRRKGFRMWRDVSFSWVAAIGCMKQSTYPQ